MYLLRGSDTVCVFQVLVFERIAYYILRLGVAGVFPHVFFVVGICQIFLALASSSVRFVRFVARAAFYARCLFRL